MNARNKKKLLIFHMIAICVALIVVFAVVRGNFSNRIAIYYYGNNSSSYQGDVARIYYNYGEGFQERDSASASIFKRLALFDYKRADRELQSVRIDFTNTNEKIGIARLEVQSGMFSISSFTGKELAEKGMFSGCSELQVEDDHVWVTPEAGDLSFAFSEEANREFVKQIQGDKWCKISWLLLWILFLASVYILSFYFYRTKVTDKFYMLLSCVGMMILLLILVMGTMSVPYGHPDEDETRGSIDYYLYHWGLPDFSDKSLENTFSNYGTIRLKELSPYYFLAGKAGFIFKEMFHLTAYYRMFNVMLFAILVIYVIAKGRKHKWMFFPLCLTPQLWYLFSYATSDAWDYFIGFFVITGAMGANAFLANALQDGWSVKKMLQMAAYAFLCAQIFMAKDNFYVILLLAFLIFLFQMFKNKEKKEILLKYGFIVLSALLIFGTRVAVDYWRYDGTKMEQYREARMPHVSSEIQEKKSFREQGLTLSDAYTFQDGFPVYMFKSFTGCYGWMTSYSGYYYYHLMGFLYILMLVYIWPNIKNRWKAYAVTGACGLLYFVTLYHAWSADYQAQGRYLLPCLLGVAYLVAESKVMEDKKFQRVFLLTVCLGGYSFVRYGIVPLV